MLTQSSVAASAVQANTTIVCKDCPPASSTQDIVTREPIPSKSCDTPPLSVIPGTATGTGSMPGGGSPTGSPTGAPTSPIPVSAAAGGKALSGAALVAAIAAMVL